MPGVAEKARFYLERSVPQLREWEDKEIFTKDEIRTIVQKRNEHEHRVLSPGNKPFDWSSYAQWEKSLETLRTKRCNRLKVRHLNSAHTGQARVMAIYERGVNRHNSSSDLWREYLTYTANIRAAKRFRKTMTNALRMIPNDAQLWIMAGRRSALVGDMAAARGFFMRGCRFCTKDETLWVEYARCEMEWLKKVEKRKSTAKPGDDVLRPDKSNGDDDVLAIVDDSDEDNEDGGNVLPEPSQAQAKVIDQKSAQKLQSNPAMDGAIPIAIFDISRKQPFFKPESAEKFYITFASFRKLSVQPRISQHVLDFLDTEHPNHPSTATCHIRQPIMGVSPAMSEFPKGLRESLTRLGRYLESSDDRGELCRKTVEWIDEYLGIEGLDEGIRKVFEHTKTKLSI